HLWGGKGGGPVRRLFGSGKQACLAPVLQTVTLPTNVDCGRMMEQAIENRGGNNRIAENRAPVTIAFVRGQDDTAPFVAGTHQLEEDGGAQLVQWQVTHLIDDEDLGRQVHAHPPVETA